MIKAIIQIFKEVADTCLRTVGRLFLFPVSSNAYVNIAKKGFFKIENYLSPGDCDRFIDEIDKYLGTSSVSAWTDDAGSDRRIFHANRMIKDFEGIFQDPFIHQLASEFYGSRNINGFLLANRLIPVDGNLGSGGGWHRDSPTRSQLKAIIYLSDVTERNGPFTLVSGTHRKVKVIREMLLGRFLPAQYRFTDAEIEAYVGSTKDQMVKSFTGKKGDLFLVDTKAIHRGIPMEKGVRYAITFYLFSGEIPGHMLEQSR